MRVLRPFALVMCFLALLAGSSSLAQASEDLPDSLNRTDEMGRRQGYWQLVAPQSGKPGYVDGQVVEEGAYANGKRAGVWKRYWPSGKLMSEITYRSGRPKGPYTIYYPTGQTEEKGTWDLDRNTGRFERWHTNGQPAQEFVFNEFGQRDGVQRYYHENGQLAVEVTVVKGQEEGTLKRYHANGELHQVAEFNGGVINEANSRYIKPVKQPVKPAPSTEVERPAPKVTEEESTNAVMFRANGFNTLYDKQLRLSQTGEFRNGQLWNGKRYRYDTSGTLTRIEIYREGRYMGDGVIGDEDRQ